MTYALQHVTWEACAVEPARDRALESYCRRKQGIVTPAIPYFAPVPWLARAVVDLRPEYGLVMHVDETLADLVSLVVSQENSCRFCYAAMRLLLWAKGVSNERLERIEQELTSQSSRTAAAVAFGRAQSRSRTSSMSDAIAALRRERFSDDEIWEIAYVVAETDFSNRAHTILAMPARPLEDMPQQWHMRLLRPWLKRTLFRCRRRGQPTPVEDAPSYPYAGILKLYAGSPIAKALRCTLDGMWASPHLTRRCKLLMLAVIARGLGCETCALEVRGALRREDVDARVLADVVTHLDAPELSDVERRLVMFARETIWYEPAVVQQSARALRRALSGPQLLEAVGVAALANGLCRLGAMVAPPR